jgi:hypothetical protein
LQYDSYCNTMLVLYEDLLKNIATTVNDTTLKNGSSWPPQVFYAKVLETAEINDLIDLSDEIYDYLGSALTIPGGSADAERGFNVLFNYQDFRRIRLSIKTIDNILKIRLNGPPIAKFVCYKFVKE